MSKNNNIKCDVTSCDYNDNANNCCTLDSIKVSCECSNITTDKNSTICDSFKCDCGCKDEK